jgi:TolB protein
MDADGSNPRNLTSNSAGGGTPAWSPDGTKIAFVFLEGYHGDIWVMNADGTNQTRLTGTE